MSLTVISSVESARRKFFFNSTYIMSSRNQTFLGSGGRNESNSHQFARIGGKNIFHQLDVHQVQKVRIKRFCAQEAEMSLTVIKARSNRREENFSSTRRTSCLESRNQTFLGSGGRNESNNHQLARIGEKKIFHQFDVHHVLKVGMKRFWAQEAEMSPTAKVRSKWREENFSCTQRTSCPESRNQTFLGSGGRNESNSQKFARIGEKKIFHQLDVHHV